MKTHQIEVLKFKAASNNAHGQVMFRIDALLSAKPPADGVEPSSSLLMTEANARVLMALLKTQLAAFDARKPQEPPWPPTAEQPKGPSPCNTRSTTRRRTTCPTE